MFKRGMFVRIIGNEGCGRAYKEDPENKYIGLHHFFEIDSIVKIETVGIRNVYALQNKLYQVANINDIEDVCIYSKLEIL